MITDIKFDCTHCGQRMVVEEAAGGLATECPSCRESIVIPRTASTASTASLHDRSYEMEPARGRRANGNGVTKDRVVAAAIPAMADEPSNQVDAAALRHEVLEATRQISRLEAQVTAGTAAAELAGVELEKAKAERRKLRDELVQIKKDLAAREEELATTGKAQSEAEARALTLAEELTRTEGELAALQEETVLWQGEITTLSTERAELLPRLESTEQQAASTAAALEATETARRELEVRCAALQAERTATLAELQTLEARLSDTALHLAAAEAHDKLTAEKLAATSSELATVQKQFADTDETAKSLAICLEELKKDRDDLRRSLSEDTTGKDLVETRTQLQTAEKERDRLTAETQRLGHELEVTRKGRNQVDEQMKALSRELDEARRRAEAASEVRLRQDNEVLRGIIARQNSELEQKHVQLVRLKRARLGVRLAYAAFGLALLGIALWAMKTVPGLSLGKLF